MEQPYSFKSLSALLMDRRCTCN